MKALDSFTVEEIEEIISSCQQEIHNTPTSDEFPVSPRLLLSLAAIALAAKRAEPDYYIVRLEHSDAWGKEVVLNTYEINLDAIKSKADHGGEIIPTYTTPQLNSPEIPEGWNSTLETAAKLIDLCRTYTILGDSGSYKERTINDCELTMQEIESYLTAAPEPQNQQQNIPEIIHQGWTSSDPANAALVMLDRIDTMDSADDDRIEDIKLIIRQLAAEPEKGNG
ncbi:Uncharacterised protein [Yersinia pekkanenii]|uniref:Uncharacterized protein n=1 Tax=Yersinia pekkanenii TaxID=1288385 RepID=A0A0T9RK48_9GAMM|nr:hypothetical protein [Yersinia pekkanenii]CNI65457.1 Uncharacterised protein [Yersinia pekkanenii]